MIPTILRAILDLLIRDSLVLFLGVFHRRVRTMNRNFPASNLPPSITGWRARPYPNPPLLAQGRVNHLQHQAIGSGNLTTPTILILLPNKFVNG